MITPKNTTHLFFYLLLLTGFFLLAEISFTIHFSSFYLGDYKLIADRIAIPTKIIPGILFFICVQLSIHFIFTVFVWGLARLCGSALQCTWQQTEKIGFVLWVLCLVTCIFATPSSSGGLFSSSSPQSPAVQSQPPVPTITPSSS